MAGRPRFKPTKAHRDDVELMKASGWSNERIAAQMKISRNTLESRFADELQYGADRVRLENLKYLRAAAKAKNASAIKQLNDRLGMSATLRPDGGDLPEAEATKQPKIGKKERRQQEAEHPDTTTEMGDLMARRAALANRLN